MGRTRMEDWEFCGRRRNEEFIAKGVRVLHALKRELLPELQEGLG